jgi:hypothetical protein
VAQLYVNIPGTASGQHDLDDVERKCSTVLMKVDSLLLPAGGKDQLTKDAVDQLRKYNKSISQILGGLILLAKADADRVGLTAKTLKMTDQSIHTTVPKVTTNTTFKAH